MGSGKTALLLCLCKKLRDKYQIAAVTNDIFTREDAEFLVKHKALSADRIMGVETGGCPHTAIRDDVVRRIRAEVEAGTYLNRERINATADRLHRAFAPAGRPRGPSL